MADLTAQSEALGANALTMSAAAALGDAFVNDGTKLLLVQHTNGAGTAVTLTVATEYNFESLVLPDKDISIGAGELHLIGPFKTGFFNDVDGKVQLTYSSETDIQLAVLDV